MAFADYELSTLATISAWEKEVNQLAGYTQKWGLQPTNSLALTLTTDTSVKTAKTMAENGNLTATATVTAGVIPFPATKFIAVLCYDVAGALIDTFALNEGSGTAVYGADGDLSGTLSSAAYWVICNANRTWQDKLDIAHRLLGYDILTAMYNRLSTYTDTEILDAIENPTTFSAACDLKALELIYNDLAAGGFNQLHDTKAKYYANAYKVELGKALQRATFSIGDTITDPNRLVTQGKLSR